MSGAQSAIPFDTQEFWRHRTGPIDITLNTLIEIEWDLVQPACWVDHQGEEWWIRKTHTLEHSIEGIDKALWAQEWTKAATHPLGKGLEQGGELKQSVRYLKKVEVESKPQHRGMALNIASGGYWTGKRSYEAGCRTSAACMRCGADIEDEAHLYWGSQYQNKLSGNPGEVRGS